MERSSSKVDSVHADFGLDEIRAHQRRVERRDLWVWGNALILILGLTAAVVSLSASVLLHGTRTFWGFDLSLSVRILVVLVILFTIHMAYQHFLLRRLRNELSEKQIQAEIFRRLAMFDPLTGLYNRRFAEKRLDAEIARSERKGHPLTVVLIDLNGFKQINDRYGHPFGDLALKETAQLLNRSIRGSDLAVRWGGDEFMLLLVECNLSQLQNVLVRLQPFELDVNGEKVTVGFALGWHEYVVGETAAEIIEEADRHLYANKLVLKDAKQPTLSPA